MNKAKTTVSKEINEAMPYIKNTSLNSTLNTGNLNTPWIRSTNGDNNFPAVTSNLSLNMNENDKSFNNSLNSTVSFQTPYKNYKCVESSNKQSSIDENEAKDELSSTSIPLRLMNIKKHKAK